MNLEPAMRNLDFRLRSDGNAAEKASLKVLQDHICEHADGCVHKHPDPPAVLPVPSPEWTFMDNFIVGLVIAVGVIMPVAIIVALTIALIAQ